MYGKRRVPEPLMAFSADHPVAGVILAGGQARRMGGGDKSLLVLDGRPILSHVIERLSAQTDDVALNANGDPERFRGFGLPVIPDLHSPGSGPLAGVLAGMDWAHQRGLTHIVTAAADTPFFPTDLVERLQGAVRRGETAPALAATHTESGKLIRHPTFGLWPTRLRNSLRRSLAQGIRKVVLWTDPLGATTAVFESGCPDPFFNINSPDDLRLAREHAAELRQTPAANDRARE